jgi:transposase-like protein
MAKAKVKRSGNFGMRYPVEEQQRIVADWVAEQSVDAPRTQQQFCKDFGITALTLNRWVKAAGQSGTIKARRGRPAGSGGVSVKRAKVGKRGRPAGITTRGDDGKQITALLAEIVKQTAVITNLRAQLHAVIDAI